MDQYELISCRVNDLRDLHRDEQILANDYLVKRPHRTLGEWWYAPMPVHFEKTPISIRSEAPEIGQHTNEILTDLGYSEQEVKDLREQAVV